MMATPAGRCRDCGEVTAWKDCTGDVSAVPHRCARTTKIVEDAIVAHEAKKAAPDPVLLERAREWIDHDDRICLHDDLDRPCSCREKTVTALAALLADVKQERDLEWCEKVNSALTTGEPAVNPSDAKFRIKDDISEAREEADRQGWERCREAAGSAVPSNWVDSLLTGPESALNNKPGKWGCPEVEKLLRAVRHRVLALPYEEPKK